MIVPKNLPYNSPLPQFSNLNSYGGPATQSVAAPQAILQPAPIEGGIPWGALLLGGLAVAGAIALASGNAPKKRYCGACGRAGHQRNNCPYTGQRAHFSRSVPKSRRCQCCGQSRYETQRHHPRGRADASDRLDVCGDCHVVCGHDGHYRNPARKPYVCQIMNRPSAWRG